MYNDLVWLCDTLKTRKKENCTHESCRLNSRKTWSDIICFALDTIKEKVGQTRTQIIKPGQILMSLT